MRLGWLLVMTLALGALSFGPCGGSGGPAKPTATSTPSVPQPEDVMGQWVQQNRNVAFVGDCANARNDTATNTMKTMAAPIPSGFSTR